MKWVTRLYEKMSLTSPIELLVEWFIVSILTIEKKDFLFPIGYPKIML